MPPRGPIRLCTGCGQLGHDPQWCWLLAPSDPPTSPIPTAEHSCWKLPPRRKLILKDGTTPKIRNSPVQPRRWERWLVQRWWRVSHGLCCWTAAQTWWEGYATRRLCVAWLRLAAGLRKLKSIPLAGQWLNKDPPMLCAGNEVRGPEIIISVQFPLLTFSIIGFHCHSHFTCLRSLVFCIVQQPRVIN